MEKKQRCPHCGSIPNWPIIFKDDEVEPSTSLPTEEEKEKVMAEIFKKIGTIAPRKLSDEERVAIEKEIDDAKFESSYWAGRMIDMPDSEMAWDIANEVAQEINDWRSNFETHKLLAESYRKELISMQEYSTLQTQQLQNRVKELEGRLEDAGIENGQLRDAGENMINGTYSKNNLNQ